MGSRAARSAAIYVRISDDPTQQGSGVERQREDCIARADALGWQVGQVYSDNDVSAYKRDVVRPGWKAMLADLEAGLRDGVVVYDLDRVARQPRDLEDLLEVVESRSLPTAVVTGDVDLATSNGRFMARLLVNVANKASADTARRVSRQRLQAAKEGRPRSNARRQFGYDREVRVIPAEAEIVREMFQRAIAGEGHMAIASDLTKRGIPTSTGKPVWQPSTVRSILRNPHHAALSAVKGEIVGKGQWEPIVSEETFYAAQAALATRATSPGHNARKHLLTGFLICGRCGSRLVSNHEAYVCRSATGGCGRISRRRSTVDECVTEAVLGYFAQMDLVEPEQDDLMPQIAKAQAKVGEIQKAYDDDLIGVADYAASITAARTALGSLLSRQNQQVLASARQVALIDPRASWAGADLARRRLLIDQVIEAVVIGPAGRGGRDPLSSISIVWAT